jgi:hypothetical protein
MSRESIDNQNPPHVDKVDRLITITHPLHLHRHNVIVKSYGLFGVRM